MLSGKDVTVALGDDLDPVEEARSRLPERKFDVDPSQAGGRVVSSPAGAAAPPAPVAKRKAKAKKVLRAADLVRLVDPEVRAADPVPVVDSEARLADPAPFLNPNPIE